MEQYSVLIPAQPLRLERAMRRLEARPVGARADAVRHLVEPVAQSLGPDLDGLKQYVVLRIACHIYPLSWRLVWLEDDERLETASFVDGDCPEVASHLEQRRPEIMRKARVQPQREDGFPVGAASDEPHHAHPDMEVRVTGPEPAAHDSSRGAKSTLQI